MLIYDSDIHSFHVGDEVVIRNDYDITLGSIPDSFIKAMYETYGGKTLRVQRISYSQEFDLINYPYVIHYLNTNGIACCKSDRISLSRYYLEDLNGIAIKNFVWNALMFSNWIHKQEIIDPSKLLDLYEWI